MYISLLFSKLFPDPGLKFLARYMNTLTHTFKGTAGNGVTGLLMRRFGVEMAGCTVLFVCCEAPDLPRLHPFTTGARALHRNRGTLNNSRIREDPEGEID